MRAAAYEFNYGPVLAAFKTAADKCGNVRIVYDARPGSGHPVIASDKAMEASGIRDPMIRRTSNPSTTDEEQRGESRPGGGWADAAQHGHSGIQPALEPGSALLVWYANRRNGATNTACFTAAFGVNKLFAAVFEVQKGYLRYILLEKHMLIVRGDRRVADVYLGEFMRLFAHFRFRDIAVRLAARRGTEEHESAFLKPDDSWTEGFFKEASAKMKQRLLFSGKGVA